MAAFIAVEFQVTNILFMVLKELNCWINAVNATCLHAKTI